MKMENFGALAYHVGLSVRTRGQGPNLVLIHGGSGSRTHWSKNIDALSSFSKVISFDLPGFGESATPPQGMGKQYYLAWVAQAIRLAVSDQPFHLVGFSFGGAVSAGVATLLAAQGHPPVRLTLLSPSGFGKPVGRDIQLEKIPKNGEDVTQEIREVTARNLGRWMLATEPDPSDPSIDIHLHNVSLARFDSRSISHENSLIENLEKLNVPVQILLGGQDPLVFPSVVRRQTFLTQSLPNAKVEIIPGAGHWLQYEAHGAINTRIHQFHQ